MSDPRETAGRLYREYSGLIYSKCLRTLGNREDAADAVQETFVKAFRSLDQFRYGDCHLPWLYQVATTVCLNSLRTRKRKGLVLLDELGALVDSETQPGSETRPVDRLFLQTLWDGLQRRCGQRSLEIFIAYHVDGMEQGQIAAQLNISRRSVVKKLAAVRAEAQRLCRTRGTADG